MKKWIVILLLAAIGLPVAQAAASSHTARPKSELSRKERREARERERVRQLDSLIESGVFQFRAQTYQQLPTGSQRIISGNDAFVKYDEGRMDIVLPYLEGPETPMAREMGLENYRIVLAGEATKEERQLLKHYFKQVERQ